MSAPDVGLEVGSCVSGICCPVLFLFQPLAQDVKPHPDVSINASPTWEVWDQALHFLEIYLPFWPYWPATLGFLGSNLSSSGLRSASEFGVLPSSSGCPCSGSLVDLPSRTAILWLTVNDALISPKCPSGPYVPTMEGALALNAQQTVPNIPSSTIKTNPSLSLTNPFILWFPFLLCSHIC